MGIRFSKRIKIIVTNKKIVNPIITSTGTIDSSLLSSPSSKGYESCRSISPHLTLNINGTTIGQDGHVTVHVGDTFNVKVYLPTTSGLLGYTETFKRERSSLSYLT